MTEPYDCENCEHYVRITDGRTAKDRICIFDGECEHLPMTNEEWFCGLSTEEKVSALVDMAHQIKARMKGEIGSCNKFEEGGYFREWLKEVHK